MSLKADYRARRDNDGFVTLLDSVELIPDGVSLQAATPAPARHGSKASVCNRCLVPDVMRCRAGERLSACNDDRLERVCLARCRISPVLRANAPPRLSSSAGLAAVAD